MIAAQARQETFARVFVVHVRRIAQVLLLLVYWLLQLSSSELNNYYHSATFVVREKFSVLVEVSEFLKFEVSGFVVVYIKAIITNVCTKSVIMVPVLSETTWERDQCMRNVL